MSSEFDDVSAVKILVVGVVYRFMCIFELRPNVLEEVVGRLLL